MKNALILLCLFSLVGISFGGWCADAVAPTSRGAEWWPSWHVTVLPDETDLVNWMYHPTFVDKRSEVK